LSPILPALAAAKVATGAIKAVLDCVDIF
jgi:hypothetical protein